MVGAANFFSEKAERNFLDQRAIDEKSREFRNANRGRIQHAIHSYLLLMNSSKHTPVQKIAKMLETLSDLQAYTNSAENKDFGNHVTSKLYSDIQQKLKIPAAIAEHIFEAYEAIVKTGKEDNFIGVVAEAQSKDKLTSESFAHYLYDCIQESTETSSLKMS